MSHIQPPSPLNSLSIKPCPGSSQMLSISRYKPMLRSKNLNKTGLIRHHSHHIQEPITIELTVTLVTPKEPSSTKRLNTLLKVVRP